MSSSYVRTNVKTYFSTEFPGETLVDYTAEERQLSQILKQYGLDYKSDWYAIQFIGSDEEPISIASNTNKGCYRERGSLFFHVVTPAVIKSGVSAADRIIPNAEAVIEKFRGARINDIVVESVTPINTESGGTLEFEQGFTSGSFIVSYYRDINL